MLRKFLRITGKILLALVVLAGALVAYMVSLADKRLSFPEAPYPTLVASTDSAVIAKGRYLVQGPAHCASCHGMTDTASHGSPTADVALVGGFEFSIGPLGAAYAANLTSDRETGIGALTDAEIARVVRTGIKHDNHISLMMRFSAAQPSDDDLIAILSYLRSLPPVHNAVPAGHFTMLGKVLLPTFPLSIRTTPVPAGVPATDEPNAERGKYLAEHVALCINCHTPYNPRTYEIQGDWGGGGSVEPSHGKDADMEFAPPNLTSDPETGYTGRTSEDQFVARFRQPRVYESSIMPWEQFAQMTDSDIRSIYRYLRKLAMVRRDTGPSYRKQGWSGSR